VARGDVGLEEEFELFMQLSGTYFGLLLQSCGALLWITGEMIDTGCDVCTSFFTLIRA